MQHTKVTERPTRVKVRQRDGLLVRVPEVSEFIQIGPPQNTDEIEARIRNARGFTAMAVAGGILVTSTAPPSNRALLPLRFYFALTTDDNGVSTIHAYPWEVLVKLYEILE